jgi:hypothetical protein
MIEFRAAGATLTLSPGESGVLNPGEVSPDTVWEVVFFDLGEPYVFDGGTFGICEQPMPLPTPPLTYSVSVAEGCTDGEPVVNFTNTGTGRIHATIGTFTQQINPGTTVAASWPTAHGDLPPQLTWRAHELADPTGNIGPEFATGTVSLANACGVTTGPVDRPNGVVRNLGGAIPASVNRLADVAPAPIARFEGTGTTTLDLGARLLADDELYLLDVVFTAESDVDTLVVDELDERFDHQFGGLVWFDGSFEGRFLLNAGNSTTRYLGVETEGSWTFTIWPFLSTVERWQGGEAHGVGANVLLFTGETGVVSFAHRGKFTVDFYGDDGVPNASIDELEDVDGTVVVPVSPSVVVIDAAGEWWLRR